MKQVVKQFDHYIMKANRMKFTRGVTTCHMLTHVASCKYMCMLLCPTCDQDIATLCKLHIPVLACNSCHSKTVKKRVKFNSTWKF